MTDMIEYSTVEMMVDAFNASAAEITEAYRLLESAQQRLEAAFNTTRPNTWKKFQVNPRHGSGVGTSASEHVIALVHRASLFCIVEKLRIQPVLSEKRWRELHKSIEEDPVGQLPQITHEGIAALAEGIAARLGNYFAEAVEEVYEMLRPRPHWRKRLKTNSEFKVGKKVILSYHVQRSHHRAPGGGWRNGWDITYSAQQGLLALDNVFHYLDGKAREVETYYGELSEGIKAAETDSGETTYFKFRCFRNGNLHVTFKRLDLVQELNAMVGSNKLRPRDVEDAGAAGWEPAVVGAGA